MACWRDDDGGEDGEGDDDDHDHHGHDDQDDDDHDLLTPTTTTIIMMLVMMTVMLNTVVVMVMKMLMLLVKGNATDGTDADDNAGSGGEDHVMTMYLWNCLYSCFVLQDIQVCPCSSHNSKSQTRAYGGIMF